SSATASKRSEKSYPRSRISLEDIVATKHLRITVHARTAVPGVLNHVAFKKRMGTAIYKYTISYTILNCVPSEVADTGAITHDSTTPTVDGESLHRHAARVLNINDWKGCAGTARDRGTVLSNQCQAIHTLNREVFSATAGNS